VLGHDALHESRHLIGTTAGASGNNELNVFGGLPRVGCARAEHCCGNGDHGKGFANFR